MPAVWRFLEPMPERFPWSPRKSRNQYKKAVNIPLHLPLPFNMDADVILSFFFCRGYLYVRRTYLKIRLLR